MLKNITPVIYRETVNVKKKLCNSIHKTLFILSIAYCL